MYIGNTVQNQGFTPQVDFFSGNASTTAFTLSRPVASVYQMVVVVANVIQNPGSAYTVSSNTITFSSAPPTGTNNIWVEYTSLITQVIAPSPGTVGTSQLQSNLTLGGTTTASTITSAASTNLSLQTNNGTTAVTIDTNQNVGVGVTPSAWGSGYKAIELGGSGSYFAFNYTSANGFIYWNMWYDGTNNKTKQTGNIAAYGLNSAGQYVWFNGTGTTGTTSSLTQAMTLDTSGNLLVGTTTSAGRLTVKGTTTDNSTTGITVQDSSANSLFYVRNDGLVNTGISTNSPYNATTASSANLLVTSSGTLSRATSALKYKQDVRNLEDVNISTFRPVRYKSKCALDNSTNDYIGFIADEYVNSYPELVSFGSEGQVEGFAYERMTAILCKAIQELSAQVTTLQTQVTALQAKAG